MLLAFTALNTAHAQKSFYNSKHAKKEFISEEITLDFKTSGVKFKRRQSGAFLAAAIPLVLDFGFKTTTKMLEKNVKKFTAEYTKYNSCLEMYENPPEIIFSRTITYESQPYPDQAILIELEPKQPADTLLAEYFYYGVKELKLNYSAAKSTKKFPTFDYTIELKLEYIENKERKSMDLKPIVISSVAYEDAGKVIDLSKYRTELITMPDAAYVIGASIKIVETNPGKVRAEKISSAWNDNKEAARTIINYFVPKEKEDKKPQDSANAAAVGADGEATVSNKPSVPGSEKKPAKKNK